MNFKKQRVGLCLPAGNGVASPTYQGFRGPIKF